MNNKMELKELKKEIITSIIWIAFLLILITFMSVKVYNENFEKDRINTLTSGYLSFNYTESDTNVINLVSAMPIKDSVGKKSNKKEDYFEFSISNSNDHSISYEIIVEPLVNKLKGEYLKLYLTDDENKPMDGFKEKVPTWSEFKDAGLEGTKIIYRGHLDGKATKTFRLRVWISEDFVVSDKAESFSFKINIKDIDVND